MKEKKDVLQFTRPLDRRKTAIAKFEDCLKELNQFTSDQGSEISEDQKQSGLYDLKKCGVDLGDDDDLDRMINEDAEIKANMEKENEKEAQAKLAEY